MKKNWLLVVILILGAVFRLYKIDQYMTFLGDEGRDVLIVRNLLVHADPILIGPGTSIGGMYLGPLYYYLIAIPLFLANYSPVGPAIFVALLGVFTIWFIWKVGSEMFGSRVGYFAASLYAISPTVIIFSRSSWNPNVMPFFALLSIYSIWKFYKSTKVDSKAGWWLVICAVSFAFVLQSHYLGLLLAPTIGIYFLLKVKNFGLTKEVKKYTLYAVLAFAFLMSPLVIFDFRHDYLNSKALYKFLTVRQETVSIRPWTSLSKIPGIFNDINNSLLAGKNKQVALWVTTFFIFGVTYLLSKKRKVLNSAFYILLVWISVALVGLGLYKQHIYDHYYGFIFPVIFLLVAFLISKLNKYLGYLIFATLVIVNLWVNPLKFHPNNQMQRSMNVARVVLENANGKPFNFAVLAERNYEDGYRYFLEKEDAKVMHADRWDGSTIVDQLFVVCEMEEVKCDPTHSPKAEVANFGMSKIDQKWNVDGVIIYKLSHVL